METMKKILNYPKILIGILCFVLGCLVAYSFTSYSKEEKLKFEQQKLESVFNQEKLKLEQELKSTKQALESSKKALVASKSKNSYKETRINADGSKTIIERKNEDYNKQVNSEKNVVKNESTEQKQALETEKTEQTLKTEDQKLEQSKKEERKVSVLPWIIIGLVIFGLTGLPTF